MTSTVDKSQERAVEVHSVVEELRAQYAKDLINRLKARGVPLLPDETIRVTYRISDRSPVLPDADIGYGSCIEINGHWVPAGCHD